MFDEDFVLYFILFGKTCVLSSFLKSYWSHVCVCLSKNFLQMLLSRVFHTYGSWIHVRQIKVLNSYSNNSKYMEQKNENLCESRKSNRRAHMDVWHMTGQWLKISLNRFTHSCSFSCSAFHVWTDTSWQGDRQKIGDKTVSLKTLLLQLKSYAIVVGKTCRLQIFFQTSSEKIASDIIIHRSRHRHKKCT